VQHSNRSEISDIWRLRWHAQLLCNLITDQAVIYSMQLLNQVRTQPLCNECWSTRQNWTEESRECKTGMLLTVTVAAISPACQCQCAKQSPSDSPYHCNDQTLTPFSYICSEHANWIKLQLGTIFYSNGSIHSAWTDWAPTALVSLQPIKSWHWPINVSCNWVY